MTQKNNTLRLVSEIISEDHGGLEMAINKDSESPIKEKQNKTKQKFKEVVRLKLSEQWQDLNEGVKF